MFKTLGSSCRLCRRLGDPNLGSHMSDSQPSPPMVSEGEGDPRPLVYYIWRGDCLTIRGDYSMPHQCRTCRPMLCLCPVPVLSCVCRAGIWPGVGPCLWGSCDLGYLVMGNACADVRMGVLSGVAGKRNGRE